LLTLRAGEPYDSWDVKTLARSLGLSLHSAEPFHPAAYPGYAHRRTIGFDDRISAQNNEDITRSRCVTYVFWRRADAQEQATTQKGKKTKKARMAPRAGDDSD
ncbi:hypothetical protein HK405_000517, partial [Cladochytrium tenue]